MSSLAEESQSSKKMIKLMSLDGEKFELEEKAAVLSVTIKHMIEADCATELIPLPNLKAKTLSLVIDYCNLHVDGVSEENRKKFDEEMVNQELETIFELLLAANYLDVKGLLDLLCQAVADRIKDESVERVRELFNIQNDFTPEEEAAVRNENAWAFQ